MDGPHQVSPAAAKIVRERLLDLRLARILVGGEERRHLRCHALLIQQVRPAAGWIWQNHHRRKLPAKGDRFLTFWHVVHVLGRAICRGHRIRTGNTTRINSDPEPFPLIRFGQVAGKDFSQVFFIDAPIFKRLIQTGPLALKPQRLSHFGKRFGLRFSHESIDGIEQGVLPSQKTVINVVTKLSQCGNVFQTSKLPLTFDDQNFTRLGRPSQGWGAFCLD
jgi:hypothetical protein